REVPVQRPDPHAGQVGDLLGGRVHPRGSEDGLGRLEQGAEVALRVGAPPPRRRALRHDPPSPGPPERLRAVTGKTFRLRPRYGTGGTPAMAGRDAGEVAGS